jgi:hypothetical protein
MTPIIKTIVRSMFKHADIKVNIDKINFKDEQHPYYHKYSWTKKQEKSFKQWMINYLLKSKKAREYMLTVPTKNKSVIIEATDQFLFGHGLITK